MRIVLSIVAALIAIFAAGILRGPTSAVAQTAPVPAVLTAEHDFAVKGVYDALRRPWTDMCNDAARTQLASALSAYFIGRSRAPQKSRWRWPWAKPVVADHWDSERDASVNLLTQVSFERGFVALVNLDESARPAVAELLRGKPVGQQCERRPEPWRLQEARHEADRASLRTDVMAQLSQLWPETCPGLNRAFLANYLSRYFESRSEDHARWVRWANSGLRYVTAAWGTADDRTIESLTRKAVAQRLVNTDAIRPGGRALYASVVKGTTPNARPCDKGVLPPDGS